MGITNPGCPPARADDTTTIGRHCRRAGCRPARRRPDPDQRRGGLRARMEGGRKRPPMATASCASTTSGADRARVASAIEAVRARSAKCGHVRRRCRRAADDMIARWRAPASRRVAQPSDSSLTLPALAREPGRRWRAGSSGWSGRNVRIQRDDGAVGRCGDAGADALRFARGNQYGSRARCRGRTIRRGWPRPTVVAANCTRLEASPTVDRGKRVGPNFAAALPSHPPRSARPGDAGDVVHGCAAGVADPDADGDAR